MKKFYALAAAVLLVAAQGAAQSLSEIYDAFREKPGVEFMELSGQTLLEMFKAQLPAGNEALIDSVLENNEQLRVLRNIDSIVVLSLDAGDCGAALLKEFKAKTANLKSLGYEVLLNSSEDDEQTLVLTRTDDDGTIKELLVRDIEANEAQLVLLTGRFNPDDWSKIVSFGDDGDEEDDEE